MEYAVKITARAEHDLEAIFQYVQADTSPAAEAWFTRFVDSIASLSKLPLRNPTPPEDPRLRQLLFGAKPHIYRIIYDVDTSTRTVTILHVRHGARKPIGS